MSYKKQLLVVVLMAVGTGIFAQAKLRKTYNVKRMNETAVVFIDGVAGASYLSEYEIYNDDGQWIERVDLLPDGSIKLKESRKFKGDNIIEETTDQPEDRNPRERPAEYEKKVYEYKKDQKRSEKVFDREGNLIETTTFSYNSFGDVLEKITTYVDNNVVLKEVYVYDNRGFRTEKQTFIAAVLVEIKTYAYE